MLSNGEMLFAIDQQQYLQGYLPVVFLLLYKTNLNTVGGGLPSSRALALSPKTPRPP